MLTKLVAMIIGGTLIIGGCTFLQAQEQKELELNRYEKIEQQIENLTK